MLTKLIVSRNPLPNLFISFRNQFGSMDSISSVKALFLLFIDPALIYQLVSDNNGLLRKKREYYNENEK
jgi:hypothetical protein